MSTIKLYLTIAWLLVKDTFIKATQKKGGLSTHYIKKLVRGMKKPKRY